MITSAAGRGSAQTDGVRAIQQLRPLQSCGSLVRPNGRCAALIVLTDILWDVSCTFGALFLGCLHRKSCLRRPVSWCQPAVERSRRWGGGAPSGQLRPAAVSLTASASFSGICTRLQPLWRPPLTAYPTAPGVPSLLMHPCGGGLSGGEGSVRVLIPGPEQSPVCLKALRAPQVPLGTTPLRLPRPKTRRHQP